MTKDISKYYDENPDEVFYHKNFLERFEQGTVHIDDVILRSWLEVAVYTNRSKSIELILNRLAVPLEPKLTLQERLSLYCLGICGSG